MHLSGAWTVDSQFPSSEALSKRIEQGASGVSRLQFDSVAVTAWDSSLLTFLIKIIDGLEPQGIEADWQGLPGGVQGLLRLAYAVPQRKEAHKKTAPAGFLTRLGRRTLVVWQASTEVIGFLGELSVALLKLFTGRARLRRSEFALIVGFGRRRTG